jgi:rhodanese-related sulfurtransferase
MVRTITTDELADLIDDGDPQLVEVLPTDAFDAEHLPGAVSVPLLDLNEHTVGQLDPKRPVVTYCYDYQCDLSSRAAWRLESLGFADVYDYTASKVAWFASGRPAEGSTPDRSRAGAIARSVPTCQLTDTVADVADRFDDTDVVVVVTAEGVVLGLLRREVTGLPDDTPVASAMQPAPATVRPSITAAELAESMTKDHRTEVLVTTYDGHLLGIIERSDLHGQH